MTAEQILDQCHGLIWLLAGQGARQFGEERDDWAQELRLDIIKWAHSYDPARGKATTWVTLRYRKLVGLRNRPDLRRNCALPTCALTDAVSHVVADSRQHDPADLAAEQEERALVRNALTTLTAKQRVVLGAQFGVAVPGERAEEGSRAKVFAARWGVTTQAIGQQRVSAAKRMRKKLAAVGVKS